MDELVERYVLAAADLRGAPSHRGTLLASRVLDRNTGEVEPQGLPHELGAGALLSLCRPVDVFGHSFRDRYGEVTVFHRHDMQQ